MIHLIHFYHDRFGHVMDNDAKIFVVLLIKRRVKIE